MTDAPAAGVVIDTMVVSWLFDEHDDPLTERYRALIGSAPALLSFQTVMELRFGAIQAGWGDLRSRRLDRRIAELTVVQPDDEMIYQCARIRAASHRIGHPLGSKNHDGDRWIAATAIRLSCALVSHDRVFLGVPELQIITALDG